MIAEAASATATILTFHTTYKGEPGPADVADSDDLYGDGLTKYLETRARVGFIREMARQNPDWKMASLHDLDDYLTGGFDSAGLGVTLKDTFEECRCRWQRLLSADSSAAITELAAEADYQDVCAPMPANVRCLFEYRHARREGALRRASIQSAPFDLTP